MASQSRVRRCVSGCRMLAYGVRENSGGRFISRGCGARLMVVQIDGSEHRWFEDRGPACSLLVFVDDATGKLMQLRFVRSESAFTYFEALSLYLEKHGAPIALYSDKHSVFLERLFDQAATTTCVIVVSSDFVETASRFEHILESDIGHLRVQHAAPQRRSLGLRS